MSMFDACGKLGMDATILTDSWTNIQKCVGSERGSKEDLSRARNYTIDVNYNFNGRIIHTVDWLTVGVKIAELVTAVINASNRQPAPVYSDRHNKRVKRKHEDNRPTQVTTIVGGVLTMVGSILLGQAYKGWSEASRRLNKVEGALRNLEQTIQYRLAFPEARTLAEVTRQGTIKLLKAEREDYKHHFINMGGLLASGLGLLAAGLSRNERGFYISAALLTASVSVALFRHFAFDRRKENAELVSELREFGTAFEEKELNFADFCHFAPDVKADASASAPPMTDVEVTAFVPSTNYVPVYPVLSPRPSAPPQFA